MQFEGNPLPEIYYRVVILTDTFTVDQAVNATGFGKFQVKLSLVTGLSWMADSMEMMILSIISPAIKCAWQLPDWKQALITTVNGNDNTQLQYKISDLFLQGVFLGMMLSAVFWGHLSDKYGRKKVPSIVFLAFGFTRLYCFLFYLGVGLVCRSVEFLWRVERFLTNFFLDSCSPFACRFRHWMYTPIVGPSFSFF